MESLVFLLLWKSMGCRGWSSGNRGEEDGEEDGEDDGRLLNE